MVWVDDGDGTLRGGETEFPLLPSKADSRWCAFVDCPAQSQQGVAFKPVPGNAVYWENFRSDGSGRGFQETWHAGLPVVEGTKVGLNIWSWGRLD